MRSGRSFEFRSLDLRDMQERHIAITHWANFRLNESYCHLLQVEASHHIGAFDIFWVGDRAILRTHAWPPTSDRASLGNSYLPRASEIME